MRGNLIPSASALARMLATLVASAAIAQTLAASPQEQPEGSRRATVTAGWQDGFFIESVNGEFRLQMGLLLQVDGRFALADADHLVADTFLIRRARPYLRGRLARRFEFFFNPDFAGGTLVVQDAYLDTVFTPAFRVRIGKGKTPFGLERLHSASNLLFVERGAPTALVPNRDLGVQVLGDVAGGVVSYLGGVMNGVPDGSSADVDSNDGKDLAGRLIVRPLSRNASSPLRGLGFAVSGSTGPQSGSAALPAFRTALTPEPYFSYSSAVADGYRNRYSPQVFYYYDAFGGFAEYVHTQMPVRKESDRGDVSHQAWQIAGSLVLTGEAATDAAAGVRPRANFGAGGAGAIQIAARYQVLAVDRSAFARGLEAPGSSRKAEGWTVGVNWFLTPHLKHVLNFERTVFDDDPDGPRRAESGIMFRTQLAF